MSAPARVQATANDVSTLAIALAPPPPDPAIADHVAAILEDVAVRGDVALVDLARRFDCPTFGRDMIRVAPARISDAVASAEPALRESLTVAATQIRALAEAMPIGDVVAQLPMGQRITVRTFAVSSVGVYVPGGRAAYPSSLLMAVIPAQVAGVARIAVASPCGPDGHVHESILLAAGILGIDEVYAVGGPAMIGAFAYGTDAVAPVDVISGPGSAWVAEAKRQVFGTVGIDSIAGPSEVMIIAEGDVDVSAVAADLCAQAEHGPDSPAILASCDPALIDAVAAELAHHDVEGAITLVDCDTRETAIALAEEFAPEHLQLDVPGADTVAAQIRHAGAVFVGPNGATAYGDYVAGSNHILPTGRAARYASAVSPATYLRRMSVVEMSDQAVLALTPHLAHIATAEGFPHHRRSAELRAQRIDRTER
jgi:histidinol dehydrogenase